MPWFSHHSIGRLTYVTVPPDLYKDKKWVGVSLYVACTLYKDIGSGTCRLNGFPAGNEVIYTFSWRSDQFSGSKRGLQFIHIPRADLPEQCNDSTISAVIDFSSPGAGEVEMCGIRVMYDEDVKGLVQTITQSTITSPAVYSSQDDKTDFSSWGQQVPSQKFGKVVLLILIDCPWSPLKKKAAIEWKRNFELLLQSFFRLDLSINILLGKDVIADCKDLFNASCLFPQKDIPDWFTKKSLTSTVETRLPDDLESDNNWMGFVVCAAFSVHPHPTDVGNYRDSQLTSHIHCKIRCSTSDSSQSLSERYPIGVSANNKFIWLSRRGFIFLRFISCGTIKMVMMNKSHRQLEASFESGSPALAVQECSLRILYKQDVQEYKQTLIQCFASVFDNLDHSQPYNEEDDSGHNKEPIHEDDQIASLGIASLSEDTQPETKTTVPVPQSETSGNSFNRFNSILFEPILYYNKTAVIFADFRGWEE